MNKFFLDLHVHIGRDGEGKAVKITASSHLTLPNILRECVERKGIDLIGIVDCGTSGVLHDLKRLISSGELVEITGGGWRYREKVTLFAGVELETVEQNGGRAHYLCYFPSLARLEDFAGFIWQKVKNNRLSSQVCYLNAHQLFCQVKKRAGLLIPAHVFTPFKGMYGNCALWMSDVFGDAAAEIKTIELGLSADRDMALLIPELKNKLFLANSDAHSLAKIGREYNVVEMETPSFDHLFKLLKGQQGKIVANYGLDPQLGKYHRSYCLVCDRSLPETPPVNHCPYCGEKKKFVLGVFDRIISIASSQHQTAVVKTAKDQQQQPPYYHQVPLSFLPGIGNKTKEKLLKTLGTEMKILHCVNKEEIRALTGEKIAELIIKGRNGQLQIDPGGGGRYGRITET